ncbi:MAG: methionyl-tRNA formyltransferase [Actinomycetota bacterium]
MTAAGTRPRRLVYLGTPAMAVPPLEALVAAGFDVAAVVTRVDKRRGRGGAMVPRPV